MTAFVAFIRATPAWIIDHPRTAGLFALAQVLAALWFVLARRRRARRECETRFGRW